MGESQEEAPAEAGPIRARLALHAAELDCEACGRRTPHRIVRWDAGKEGGASARSSAGGLARCRVCGLTHRFEVRIPKAPVDVALVVSRGPRSERELWSLPRGRRVQVGSGVPGHPGGYLLRRIERRDGSSVPEARSEEIATLWAEAIQPPSVPVSILEGRRTRAARLSVGATQALGVGDPVTVEGVRLTIVALRAGRQTWKRPGDSFPAQEIQRVYARRTERPPAGSSAWSRDRPSPESRARSISLASRSRSSPGERR